MASWKLPSFRGRILVAPDELAYQLTTRCLRAIHHFLFQMLCSNDAAFFFDIQKTTMSHELYVEADVAETSRISGCPKFWSFQFLSQAEKVKLTNRLRISWLSVRLPWEVQTSWIPQRLCWSQLGFGVLFSMMFSLPWRIHGRGQRTATSSRWCKPNLNKNRFCLHRS